MTDPRFSVPSQLPAEPASSSTIECTDASGYKGWAGRRFTPSGEAELMQILVEAQRTQTPVTIRGAGTGLTGSSVPQGGWLVSMEHFRTLGVSPGLARVGPAITLIELRDAAARTGQFYAPDPTEISASIGGTISTNASGSRSFRFGSTRQSVQALRVALLDGSVRWYRRGDKIDFDVPAISRPLTTKNTAGYYLQPGMDWIDLFCGSEGTLGVVIEAELTLHDIPADLISCIIFFSNDDQALNAVAKWRALPGLRMLEYADYNSLELLRQRFADIPRSARAAVLVETDEGTPETWLERIRQSSALSEESWINLESADREFFRAFRHSLPELVVNTMRSRGLLNMGTDYAVPISREREMLRFYRERLEAELPGSYIIFGHIGDAHLHVNMLPGNAAEAEIATRLLKEFAAFAVQLGGTVSAEHGLGKRKASLLALQYTAEQIAAMRSIKQRFDPMWLLGQGTLFAPEGIETL